VVVGVTGAAILSKPICLSSWVLSDETYDECCGNECGSACVHCPCCKETHEAFEAIDELLVS
jgi:hypothetical protein